MPKTTNTQKNGVMEKWWENGGKMVGKWCQVYFLHLPGRNDFAKQKPLFQKNSGFWLGLPGSRNSDNVIYGFSVSRLMPRLS